MRVYTLLEHYTVILSRFGWGVYGGARAAASTHTHSFFFFFFVLYGFCRKLLTVWLNGNSSDVEKAVSCAKAEQKIRTFPFFFCFFTISF